MIIFPDKFKCITSIDEQIFQFEIEWKIQKEVFQQLIHEKDSKRTSAVYKSNFHKFSWQLKLSHNKNNPEYLGLHLMFLGPSELTVKFQVKWNYIVKNKLRDLNDRNDQRWYELKAPGSNGYVKWQLIETLQHEEFWIDNFLIIICQADIKVLGEERTEVNQDLTPRVVQEQLSQKLLGLLNSENYSDVTILIGTEKFKVHKSMLTMNSEYFDTMFKSGFKEANDCELEIKEVNPDVFKIILEYIYAQKIPEDLESKAKDILVAADLFCLQPLFDICVQVLCKRVTLENCIDLMILAETYCLKDLKQIAVDLVKNNSKCVINTEQWKELKVSNSQLAFDIIEKTI